MLPPAIDKRSTGSVRTTCQVDTGGKRPGKIESSLAFFTLMGVLNLSHPCPQYVQRSCAESLISLMPTLGNTLKREQNPCNFLVGQEIYLGHLWEQLNQLKGRVRGGETTNDKFYFVQFPWLRMTRICSFLLFKTIPLWSNCTFRAWDLWGLVIIIKMLKGGRSCQYNSFYGCKKVLFINGRPRLLASIPKCSHKYPPHSLYYGQNNCADP